MTVKLVDLTLRAYLIPPEMTDIDRNLTAFIAAQLQLAEEEIVAYEIRLKAVDSRRGAPALVYKLAVTLRPGGAVSGTDAAPEGRAPEAEFPAAPAGLRQPVIVGSGPAGMMAGLILARAGAEPLIIESGAELEQRCADIAHFHQTREFNSRSNYLRGEGGAGTFSDGKLYTRTRDPLGRLVLEIFAAAGAPPGILYLKRPHIGSDKLPGVVRNIRREIEQAGGRFLFNTAVKELMIKERRCLGVITGDGQSIAAPAVIAAHGLGGRELTHKLIDQGVEYVLKGFQIGCRIEHPQAFIDENQYRLPHRPAWLEAAEYHLSSRADELRNIVGAASFCMCPGGEIVPGGLEPEYLSTNGMSRYARAGKFANSCLIVTQPETRFGEPQRAYQFLRDLEHAAFELGGGDYTAPAQDARAFVKGRLALKNEETSYAFGLRASRLDKLLPESATLALTLALRRFDHNFHGFLKYGKLVGIETFISSPVRFERDAETLMSSAAGLYLAGEGAGRAGGILSAAVDGIRIAGKMLEAKY
ncbi:MAG: FAD-dependent monooxygenase [Victivallaceae bacterium]|nr:FAD-dependent monooxygenase [Victivallaceae bacterium]